MQGHVDRARLRIEAPDAPAAFRLERGLQRLHPVAVGRGLRWEVDVEHFDGDERALETAVTTWLDETGLSQTTVWIDGRPRRIAYLRRR